MGAFNTLNATFTCPDCSISVDIDIQFKYGDVWQYDYKLGDRLKWGGNDVGKETFKIVKVEGLGGPCPDCGLELIDFDILIMNNIITKVTQTNRSGYSYQEYEVLEEF